MLKFNISPLVRRRNMKKLTLSFVLTAVIIGIVIFFIIKPKLWTEEPVGKNIVGVDSTMVGAVIGLEKGGA